MKKVTNGFVFGVLVTVIAAIFTACASSQAGGQTAGPAARFEGFWTSVDLDEADPMPPHDWRLLRDGSLVTVYDGKKNNSWVRDGDKIVIKINDEFSTYTFQIINDNLLKGTAVNKENLEWPVELRRIQNPVILKNKTTGDLAVLGVHGFFILDSATRLYQNLTKEREYDFMYSYMSDEDGEMNVTDDTNIYLSLLKYYNEDKEAWGFDVLKQKGSLYAVEFTRDDKPYRGVVAYFSFLDEGRYYVVPLD